MKQLRSDNLISVRVDDHCGTIVLQRPDKHNALTRNMVVLLHQALDDLHQQRSVRAIAITSQGSSFCAGADLEEIHESQTDTDQEAQWFTDAHELRQLIGAMLQCPKPIVAAVNGPARGLGVGLVLAADIVLASPSANFAFPETHRGLCAGISIPLLAFRIGAGRSAPMLLCGQTVSSDEAVQHGLVHEIVADHLLWARANELAAEVSRGAPNSILMTKRVLNETVGEFLFPQLSAAAAVTATARTTANAREGVDAFLAKRSPIFDAPEDD